jgi:CDGSH-type Zn-finger protein
MDLPKIAERCPKQIELEAGKKYAFCTCGLSSNQPFCNGSHKGTGFSPIVFEAAETKSAHFCQCKRSKNQPYCDGTHKTLAPAEPRIA